MIRWNDNKNVNEFTVLFRSFYFIQHNIYIYNNYKEQFLTMNKSHLLYVWKEKYFIQ